MRVQVISGTPWYAHAGHQAPTQLAIAFRRLGCEVFFHQPSGYQYAVNNFAPADRYGVEEVAEPAEVDVCLIEASPAPVTLDAVRAARPRCGKLIYRCLDLWEGWHRDACHEHYGWFGNEEEIIRLGDHTCAVSAALSEWVQRQFQTECQVVPNGAFYDDFQEFPQQPKEKVALYVGNKLGTIRSWGEIAQIAERYPDWTFFAAGHPASPTHYASGNFFSLPEMSDSALREFYARASIGIVAHHRNWFCYFADPNKWYMYNACGMVVASSNVHAHLDRPFTCCGQNIGSAFDRAVPMASGLADRSEVPAAGNDWSDRAAHLLRVAEQ